MKVFSLKKFKADKACPTSVKLTGLRSGWTQESNGKTAEEMKAMGYSTHEDWMVEKEQTK